MLQKHFLESHVPLLLTHCDRPNMRFCTLIFDILDATENHLPDSQTKVPESVKNRKFKCDKLNENMQIRHLKSVDLERFWLIFSPNIANFEFAFSVFSKRFTDIRFQQNHKSQKRYRTRIKCIISMDLWRRKR